MKTPNRSVAVHFPSLVALAAGVLALASGCSSGPFSSSTPGSKVASTGPTILQTKSEPGTFELNEALQPKTSDLVVASIQDFYGQVQNVTLRFNHVPQQVPMKQINPTTWEAQLSPQLLKRLAVSGKTMKYEATITAVDDHGHVAGGDQNIDITIKAPDVTGIG